MRPLTASPARTALPAAHFETQRNSRDLRDGTLGIESVYVPAHRILP
jgi:hypothetical protein